ncbi:unnamed protein product [Effrenium voratum]|nr:unnamed protein product [Effrenium voratum]CAJ1435878.1 unnamed protein product [Effrenium voratum]|mmetsp:Transcript_51723/g.123918  ORF Transcript_51723/g.123918 Transcript_51723/m.123918 type:complete len:507 (-) Transcript_51723:48-1568(-)
MKTVTVLVQLLAASALRRKPIGRKEVFVHLFEWSWEDVAKECENWLGPKGFHAVQVSPPTEHIQGAAWWTRYQPVTYNLTSRSGDEQQFASMVQRCRKVGVGIYVDVVVNHAAASSGVSILGSAYGARRTPIFEPKDFHHRPGDESGNCGVSNYADIQNVQYCDLQGLPDLCTGCQEVQTKIAAYLRRLVELGVAGVRLDAAKHIAKEDLLKIFQKVPGSEKLFKYVEVSKATTEDVVKEDLYVDVAAVTEFNYYSQLDPLIAETGRMFSLESFGTKSSELLAGTQSIVFIDNHDTQRSKDVNAAKLTYKSGKLYLLATAFMLAHPYGYPQVMSSFHFREFDQGPPSTPVHSDGELSCGEFQPWVCEHRWVGIANMVAWRRSAGDLPVSHFTALGEDTISFCRGDVACIAFNRQDEDEWEATLTLPLPAGDYCDIAQSDAVGCPLVKVGPDGAARLTVPAQGFVAIHVGARKKELEGDLGEVQLRKRRKAPSSRFLISADGAAPSW